MNKMKRLISALLTVCLMLGSLVGLSIVEIGATAGATDGTETAEPIDYLTKVFASPEEKLATMTKKVTKDGFEIWVDSYSGEVATVNQATGQILFTNPYDVASADASNSDSTREELLSQIIIKYVDNANNGVETTFLSYTRAALNNQIKVKNIKNGIRVEYTIGREETKYLVPRMMEKARFEELIYNHINSQIPEDPADPEGKQMKFLLGKLKAYYTLIDPDSETSETIKNQFYTDYPVTKKIGAIYVFDENASAKELTTCESIIKSFCPEYTYEQLEVDHARTEYASSDQNPPLFKLALEYTITGNGVTVRLPVNGLRFDESLYELTSLNILPYMGAGSYTANAPNTGYTFFPDGSGSLFRFEDLSGSYSTIISGQVYGQDFAYHTITGTHQETVRFPVFGVVQNRSYEFQTDATGAVVAGPAYVKKDTTVDSGYVAILEKGEALASLYTYHVPNVNKYHTIQMTFNPRPKDSFILADAISVGSTAPVTLVSERKYVGDFQIKYILLSDDELAAANGVESYYTADWLGMKDAYSDYLIEQGVLTRLQDNEVEKSIPLYIETFGTIPTVEKILSVPVTVMTPLTSFEDIQTMYDDLNKVGITNVNFKLTGYANGGMYSTVPYGLKWEKAVGGKKGFEELLAYAAEVNAKDGQHLGIYPDFDFAYISGTDSFDGVSLDKHAARTIDDRFANKREYSATSQAYISYFDLAMSPAYYHRFYEKLTSNYLKYSLAGDGSDLGISVGSLGSALNSDFDEDEPYNREDSKKFTVEAFEYLSNTYGSVMTESANAYTWKYIDHMLKAPLDSSRFLRASNSVPFVGYILHGYMEYAGSPINMEGDIQYALLKSIENGASLYFTLSYQNTTKLKDFFDLSQYYSVRYDIWVGAENDEGVFETGQLVDLYNQLNKDTADLQTKLLIDHEFLTGERIPDEDEAEADRIAAEEAKTEAEKQAALAEQQKWAADILEAKTTALATAADALAAAKDLLTKFDLPSMEESVNNEDLTSEDEASRAAALEYVKSDLKAVLDNVNAIKAKVEIVNAKAELLKNVYDAFVKDGAVSAAYLADLKAKVDESAAMKVEADAALATANETLETAKTLAAKVNVKVEDVEAPVVDTPAAPSETVTQGYNKYYVDDGSLVAVTYGGKNGVDNDPYRTFLLNYNYYAVIVVYNGTTYEIQPYDYAVINY